MLQARIRVRDDVGDGRRAVVLVMKSAVTIEASKVHVRSWLEREVTGTGRHGPRRLRRSLSLVS